MSMDEVLASYEAVQRARVLRETFGHLDAEPRRKYEGYFIFAWSEYAGDGTVLIKSDFGEDEPAGPWYYEDLQEFISSRCHPPYPRKTKLSEGHVYRFDGSYMALKNGKCRFSGKITRVL